MNGGGVLASDRMDGMLIGSVVRWMDHKGSGCAAPVGGGDSPYSRMGQCLRCAATLCSVSYHRPRGGVCIQGGRSSF